MKNVLLFLFLIVFSGCSLLKGVNTSPKRASFNKNVRDVPIAVRGFNESPRKRILVLPFLDEKPTRSDEVTKIARYAVVRALSQKGRFVIIQNTEFPKDLSGFVRNGYYDLEKISRIAHNMGVSAVLEGKVVKIQARRVSDDVGVFRKVKAKVDAIVKIRVMATKTLKEILNQEKTAMVISETTRVGEYKYSDKFLAEDPTLVKKVVTKAFQNSIIPIVNSIEKISWEGRVALVKGEKIYLNAGRVSGIQVGDILKVMEGGEEIFDPETGVFIGEVPGKMKGTIEVVSYFGKDGAVGIIHSGSGFKENDKVELY